MTLLPGMSPVLSVIRNGGTAVNIDFGAIADGMTTDNGQTVATSGNAAFWNYVARNASGQTAINFDVGGLLGAQPGGNAVLQGAAGGTEGTVTFYAKVLDRYTDTNGGASLRESDVTTNTVTGSGKVTSHIPGSTAVDESDASGVTDEVARGNLTMEITKVGSTTINPGDPVKVQAGELVTYTVTYDLTQGDYGNLDLKAFLPLPGLQPDDDDGRQRHRRQHFHCAQQPVGRHADGDRRYGRQRHQLQLRHPRQHQQRQWPEGYGAVHGAGVGPALR